MPKTPIKTSKGTFEVFTQRSGANTRVKLLLLHGGPGGSHDYFEALASGVDAELIYYDQLGSGQSDKPEDDDLWTVDRFVDEVEQVRVALGLDKNNFYLLGHSWGALLATEYALAHPQHLKGLILSNMMMSAADYNRYLEVLVGRLDPVLVEEVRAILARGDYDSPRMTELLFPAFYMKHLCRLPAWPDAVTRTFMHINKHIQRLMQGPSPFELTGRLARWDRKADLVKLGMPTLVIGARHDTMDPEHMRWVSTQVQRGTFLECPDGSHLAMWDDRARYVSGLASFLASIDGEVANPGELSAR